MKRKPMALTAFILVAAFVFRKLSFLRLCALLPWLNPKTVSPVLVGSSLIFVTCFFKAHGVFEQDD